MGNLSFPGNYLDTVKPGSRFGFDLDDVVFDFWGTGIPFLNSKYKKDHSRSNLVRYDSVADLYPVDYDGFFRDVIELSILENLTPYEGVSDFINGLIEMGCYVTLITSRSYHPYAFSVTEKSLFDHGIRYDELHIKKEGFTKADYIDGGLDYFIDDLPKNLIDVYLSGKCANLGMIDQPWNRDESRFQRLKNIYEIGGYF